MNSSLLVQRMRVLHLRESLMWPAPPGASGQIWPLMGTSSRSFGDRFPTAFPDPRVRSIHERRKESWQHEGYRVERQSSPGTRE